MKIIVGINRHHDATTCLLVDGKVVYSIEEERLNRFKHEGIPYLGLLELPKYVSSIDELAMAGFLPTVDVEAHEKYSLYTLIISRLFKKEKGTFNYHDYFNIHHLTHAAGAFYNSGFKEAISIVMDGAGSLKNEKISETIEESYSSFLFNYPCNIKTLTKKWHDKSKEHNKNNQKSLGKIYSSLTEHFGFQAVYDCGKTMGLSSYGKKINIDMFELFKAKKLKLNENHPLFYETKNMKNFKKSANVAYAVQQYVQEECLKLIKEELKKTNCKNICLSGGFALNCVNNYFLRKNLSPDINLYIEPIAHDGGTAVGAAKLLYYSTTNSLTIRKQKTTFYGLKYSLKKIKNKIRKEKIEIVNYEKVAKLLKNNKIIAMYQGRSEQGPRSLGNRSILFNPKNKNGKNIINVVKKREYFRPFAGTVLYEYMNDYFDMDKLKESPFMCYAVNVKKEKIKEIPAITHIDRTCRIQTLKKNFNLHFYNLIKDFYKLTGTPILLNTSFNLAGEPLVETIEDALITFHNSKIDYLYLPEIQTLISK
jgi:carbamoyltransferase